MNRLPWVLGIVLALVAGLAIGYVARTAKEPPTRTPQQASPSSAQPSVGDTSAHAWRQVEELQQQVAGMTKERDGLRAEIEALKAAAKAEAPAAPAAATTTPEDQRKGVQAASKAFDEMAKKGLFAFAMPDNKALLAEIKKGLLAAGDLAYDYLSEMLDGEDSTKRFLALVLLGDLDMGKALPIYRKALAHQDDLVRRTASQSLAVKQVKDAFPDLMKAMKEDKDWGVRANSAYGVAKMGEKSGVPVLVEAYKDPAVQANERLGVLWGLADIADPSTASLFRGVLETNKDDQSLIVAIGAVEKMKDQASLAPLQAIIQGRGSSFVKDPAKKAYNTICGQEVYR